MTGTRDLIREHLAKEFREEVPIYVCNCGEAFHSPWERLAHWIECKANTERGEPPPSRRHP